MTTPFTAATAAPCRSRVTCTGCFAVLAGDRQFSGWNRASFGGSSAESLDGAESVPGRCKRRVRACIGVSSCS